MRMAIVEVIGFLIKEIAMAEDEEQESREKKLNNLFELLLRSSINRIVT